MAINVNQNQTLFHLQTDHTSYIFDVMPNGELGQLYYGSRVHQKSDYQNLASREWHNDTPSWTEEALDVQPELLKQEYASFGKGDFRYPAFEVTLENGSNISELQFTGYQIHPGKNRLQGLPSTFDDNGDDAQTLEITLEDSLSKLEVVLSYAVFPHQDVIIRSAKFINRGNQKIQVNQALSLQLDLPDDDYELVQFSGTWARERHLYRNKIHSGIQSISSMRTASSHQQNPYFMLVRPNTDEDSGEALGVNLIYSGNFLDQVEVDQFNTTRILAGINPTGFGWNLEPAASFQTPEAVLSFTDKGTNQLSQQLGHFYQLHLVNPHFAHQLRPLLVNNWEATTFDIDEQKLVNFAKSAKKLGLEMLVVDDGWFGHRNNDRSSLGDWFVNKAKFPNGLVSLAERVHSIGLKFGLWFEPEMISKDSELYEAHPDWMIKTPGRHSTPQRHQFVLDMTRSEVVDYLYYAMAKMIDENKLDYIKWDMNRNITEMYGMKLRADQQTEFSHRYILGVYNLYERLTKQFPKVLFESCASGGGRFDLGMMYYAPQAWTSDNTDAIERLKIQYSTSYGYSQSMMGAHVSDVPNDQDKRITPLSTRADVAFFGDFGYELDITHLSKEDEELIKRQVQFYKKYRQLFQFGDFYRIDSPYEKGGNIVSWEVVDSKKENAIAARYQLLNVANAPYARIKFKGLDPDKQYQVNEDTEVFYGSELMNAGYFVPSVQSTVQRGASADFNAKLFVIKAR
ncbi:alpha-galactosidase [Lentilactobacillus raoultii]|uniref:Alpha-galactosidase n=1 Tax=Lentilactobacillus raoultii TaxID=1987503 RepID=A0ABW3PHF5_9LACO|nr:alpha-galactosidase [Lentilactobacillus raoultii]